MTKEEIKNKFFPLMGEDITMEITVAQAVEMISVALGNPKQSEQVEDIEKILNEKLSNTLLSPRIINILNAIGINTVGELFVTRPNQLLRVKQIGKCSLIEIQDFFDIIRLEWK